MKNKEIAKAFSLLDAKSKEHVEKIKQTDKDLNEAKATLEELKAKLATAKDTEEYKKLLAEIKDTEGNIGFYSQKAKLLVFSTEDYKEVVTASKNAHEALKKEQGELINKKIDELIDLISDYEASIKEINSILLKAGKLAGKTPTVYNKQELAPTTTEHGYFITAYDKAMGLRAIYNK